MNEKAPLIHISKRENMSRGRIWVIRLLAFLTAILLSCLVFLAAGANPVEAYSTMISGALGKKSGIRQVVKVAAPLLGTALALAPCFRMKFWNIGAEGQITIGAMAAAFFAINFGNKWPSAPLLIIMGLASMLMGAVWAAIPAAFKARWKTNETLFTLMLNYIAIGIVGWLQGGPWEGKKGSQVIPNFADAAVLPKVLGVHCGWIIVLLLVVFIYIYMKYTKHGYEIAVLGESENTARYAGMNVMKITVRTACLSGAICGLVGFMVASGANQTLYASVADGVGFTAITVAWLAQLNPFAMVIIAILFGVLSKGASSLQTGMGVPASVSDIIKGLLLLCLLGCEFFINYKLNFRGHDGHGETGAAAPAGNTAVPAAKSSEEGKEAAK